MEKENIVLTVGYQNPNAFIVSVETVVRRGIFQFDIIGLANKTISESKQRILSAITSARNERRHYINKKNYHASQSGRFKKGRVSLRFTDSDFIPYLEQCIK